ncbi:Uncharacterised protein [uncultured archaeon]|nr:Uncharacterised protein [uncultured archaeon]
MAIGTMDIVLRILAATALGGLVGSERERMLKQHTAGLRTFAFVTMLGGLAGVAIELGIPFAELFPIIGFAAIVAYSYFIYREKGIEALGMTTLSVMPIMYLIGLMSGIGMLGEAAAIEFMVLAVLLAGRSLHKAVDTLDEKEINEVIQFGLILFVVFPLLPSTPVVIDGISIDFMLLFGFVLLVSMLNLLAFLVHRVFRTETSTLTGFIGGVINSSITIHDIARSKEEKSAGRASGATAAMLGSIARNTLLAAVVMPDIFTVLLPLFAIIGSVMIILMYIERRESKSLLEVEHNFTVINGLKLAGMLLVILAAFQLMANNFPDYVPLLALVSGAVSSGYTMLSLGTVYATIGVKETIMSVALTVIGSFATSTAVAYMYGTRRFGTTVLKQSLVAAVLLLGYVLLIAA